MRNAESTRSSAGSSKGRNEEPAAKAESVLLKRRHGLNRSRYKGEAGMKRWVGFGVIADNLINIDRLMAK